MLEDGSRVERSDVPGLVDSLAGFDVDAAEELTSRR